MNWVHPSCVILQQQYFLSLCWQVRHLFLLNVVVCELRTYFSESCRSRLPDTFIHFFRQNTAFSTCRTTKILKSRTVCIVLYREASFRPVKILNALLTGIKASASVLFLLVLLQAYVGTWCWYLCLLCCPTYMCALKYSERLYKLKDSQSTKEREMYYYNRILTGFPLPKSWNFSDFRFFQQRFNKTQQRIFEEKLNFENQNSD